MYTVSENWPIYNCPHILTSLSLWNSCILCSHYSYFNKAPSCRSNVKQGIESLCLVARSASGTVLCNIKTLMQEAALSYFKTSFSFSRRRGAGSKWRMRLLLTRRMQNRWLSAFLWGRPKSASKRALVGFDSADFVWAKSRWLRFNTLLSLNKQLGLPQTQTCLVVTNVHRQMSKLT